MTKCQSWLCFRASPPEALRSTRVGGRRSETQRNTKQTQRRRSAPLHSATPTSRSLPAALRSHSTQAQRRRNAEGGTLSGPPYDATPRTTRGFHQDQSDLIGVDDDQGFDQDTAGLREPDPSHPEVVIYSANHPQNSTNLNADRNEPQSREPIATQTRGARVGPRANPAENNPRRVITYSFRRPRKSDDQGESY